MARDKTPTRYGHRQRWLADQPVEQAVAVPPETPEGNQPEDKTEGEPPEDKQGRGPGKASR